MGLAPFFCRPFLHNGCSKPFKHHLAMLGFREVGQPALERLLREAARGRFDVVVVDKVDRFYLHLQGLLSALDELNDHGVNFVSVKENLDFSTPWGKLALTVLGMLAEIYIDNLREETKKGKRV